MSASHSTNGSGAIGQYSELSASDYLCVDIQRHIDSWQLVHATLPDISAQNVPSRTLMWAEAHNRHGKTLMSVQEGELFFWEHGGGISLRTRCLAIAVNDKALGKNTKVCYRIADQMVYVIRAQVCYYRQTTIRNLPITVGFHCNMCTDGQLKSVFNTLAEHHECCTCSGIPGCVLDFGKWFPPLVGRHRPTFGGVVPPSSATQQKVAAALTNLGMECLFQVGTSCKGTTSVPDECGIANVYAKKRATLPFLETLATAPLPLFGVGGAGGASSSSSSSSSSLLGSLLSAGAAIEAEEVNGTDSELEKVEEEKSEVATEVDDEEDDNDKYDWNGDDNTEVEDEEEEPEKKKVCADAPRKAPRKSSPRPAVIKRKVTYDNLLDEYREDGHDIGEADIKARATLVWLECMCAHCGDAPRVPVSWALMSGRGCSREQIRTNGECNMVYWIDKYQEYSAMKIQRMHEDMESWLEHRNKCRVDKKYARNYACGLGRKCPNKCCGGDVSACKCGMNDVGM